MNMWFLIILLIIFVELVGVAILHGNKKEGRWNFGVTFFSHIVLLFLIYMAIKTGI